MNGRVGIILPAHARRYQVSFAGSQFNSMTPAQHISYAQVQEAQLYAKYIAKGGNKAVFGEWALAGALALTGS